MQMVLSLYNCMNDRDATVAINHSSLLLCLSRSLPWGSLEKISELLLCIPEFYGHPLTVTIRSVSELELDPGGNRLEIYPTPRLIAIEDVLGPSRSKVEETPDGSVRIPFLRIRNNTPERIVICEPLLSSAFWLPAGEEVLLDCIDPASESTYLAFEGYHDGHLFFKLDGYTTLQIAEEHLEKVRSWGVPPGLGGFWESP
jgi:hypothetical protein